MEERCLLHQLPSLYTTRASFAAGQPNDLYSHTFEDNIFNTWKAEQFIHRIFIFHPSVAALHD